MMIVFYLRPGNQARLEFNLVAEGLRKIALLWQLIKMERWNRGLYYSGMNPRQILTPNIFRYWRNY